MAVDSTRSKQLRKLADNLPGANQRVASGLQAARETQLQETIKQAKPQGGQQAAQQLGAQQAQQSGGIQLQAAQQTQQDLGKVGGMAVQQQGLESQQKIGQQQRNVSKKQRELAGRLQALDNDTKNQLLDRQLQFQTDEQGRQFMNERQMADWAIANAKTEEEFRVYQQEAMQMHEKKIQMLQTAHGKIGQSIKQNYVIEGQQLDQQQRKRLIEEQRALEEKMRKEEARRKEKTAMWRAAGTIVFGTIGGVAGGGSGAQAGGQAGGAYGEATGSAFG